MRERDRRGLNSKQGLKFSPKLDPKHNHRHNLNISLIIKPNPARPMHRADMSLLGKTPAIKRRPRQQGRLIPAVPLRLRRNNRAAGKISSTLAILRRSCAEPSQSAQRLQIATSLTTNSAPMMDGPKTLSAMQILNLKPARSLKAG